jgi:HAD superfamily hydrolase (TIGR01509 family)
MTRHAGPIASGPTRFGGAIFDVDGVLVDSPHEQAWRDALRELMEGEFRDRRSTSWSPDAFTSRVYQEQVAGKPREAGARAALAYFGLEADDAHVREYAARKQDMIERLIDAGEFAAYPDALRFVVAVKELGLRAAAASSSKNATRLLEHIRLDASTGDAWSGATLHDLFEVDVSGRDFAHGKPHPEMFLTAASELGVEPASAFVVEDSPAGVQAARAGGMGAIGVARADDAELLDRAGADLVVTTLDDVDRDALAHGRLAPCRPDGRLASTGHAPDATRP